MIYEIFSTAAEGGLTVWEYTGGVLASVHLVHVLALVLCWLASWTYGYCQDWEHSIPNWYKDKLCNYTSEVKVTPIMKDRLKQALKYRYEGVVHGSWTTLRRGWYHVQDGPKSGYWLVNGEFRELTEFRTEAPQPVTYIDHKYLFFGPLFAACALLFLDLFTMYALILGTAYGTLWGARQTVRMSKRLNKAIKEKQ